mmetsp:Transcript_8959/g.26821  ORF Transcript_8959/g.26821 Transcript_8959/m.26821 type:complete len:517 (-) Transcript_8959:1283-2833(-)
MPPRHSPHSPPRPPQDSQLLMHQSAAGPAVPPKTPETFAGSMKRASSGSTDSLEQSKTDSTPAPATATAGPVSAPPTEHKPAPALATATAHASALPLAPPKAPPTNLGRAAAPAATDDDQPTGGGPAASLDLGPEPSGLFRSFFQGNRNSPRVAAAGAPTGVHVGAQGAAVQDKAGADGSKQAYKGSDNASPRPTRSTDASAGGPAAALSLGPGTSTVFADDSSSATPVSAQGGSEHKQAADDEGGSSRVGGEVVTAADDDEATAAARRVAEQAINYAKAKATKRAEAVPRGAASEVPLAPRRAPSKVSSGVQPPDTVPQPSSFSVPGAQAGAGDRAATTTASVEGSSTAGAPQNQRADVKRAGSDTLEEMTTAAAVPTTLKPTKPAVQGGSGRAAVPNIAAEAAQRASMEAEDDEEDDDLSVSASDTSEGTSEDSSIYSEGGTPEEAAARAKRAERGDSSKWRNLAIAVAVFAVGAVATEPVLNAVRKRKEEEEEPQAPLAGQEVAHKGRTWGFR